MNQWPKQNPAAMNAFYGDPDRNRDGQCDPGWYEANIIKMETPYQLWYPNEVNGKIVKRAKAWAALRVHKKAADSLYRCLEGIRDNFSAEDIQRYELDICGGVHVFRLMRGGQSLSIHSWGAAIDISHLINSWKKKYDPAKGMMPMEVVDIFKGEGWTWGGLWRTADAMHFQASDI